MPFHAQALFLAQATPAVEPELSAWGLILAFVGAAATVGVAALLGILRPSRVGLGHRVPLNRPIAPLLGVLFAGFVVWQAAPVLFLTNHLAAGHTRPATQAAATLEDLSPRELVLISAVVPMAAFFVLLAGDALIHSHVGQRLGFGIRRLPRGVFFGAAGLLLTMPLVYGAMVASEWAYRALRYAHPSEHDLLRVMGETPNPALKYVIVAAAVIVAPLWEELLFRGHVQTLIRELLVRVREGPTPDAAGTANVETKTAHPLPSWLAIVVTSLMFAGVHTPWQMPAIFVLSLCLGFAYERTGNLWTSIVMHAGFNALMTTYFFWTRAVAH